MDEFDPEVIGFLDVVTDAGELSGWVIDRRNPNDPVRLTIHVGDTTVTTIANRTRPDVLAAGMETARCGYIVQLPARVLDGVERPVTFTLADAPKRGEIALKGIKTVRVARPAEARPAAAEPGTGAHKGSVDPIGKGTEIITGWVQDAARPSKPVFVDVWVDGTFAGSAFCSTPRDDKAIAAANPNCGFRIDVGPVMTDSFRRYDVEVVIAGTRTLVPGGRFTLLHSNARYGHFDMLRGAEIQGWSLDPTTRRGVPVTVLCDGEEIARLACDTFRGDLYREFGCEEGAFIYELPVHLLDGFEHTIRVVNAAGWELDGSPKRLTQEQQITHIIAGSVRVNQATGMASSGTDARGFRIRELESLLAGLPEPDEDGEAKAAEDEDTVRELRAERAFIRSLAADVVSASLFVTGAENSLQLIAQAMKSSLLDLNDPSVVRHVLHAVIQTPPDKLEPIVTALGANKSAHYRALILAATMIARGSHDKAADLVYLYWRRNLLSEQVTQFGAELLLYVGLVEEAADLLMAGAHAALGPAPQA